MSRARSSEAVARYSSALVPLALAFARRLRLRRLRDRSTSVPMFRAQAAVVAARRPRADGVRSHSAGLVDRFGDPELNELIQRAIDEGVDLRIAALRLDKAGMQLGKDQLRGTPKVGMAPADSIARGKQDSADMRRLRARRNRSASVCRGSSISGARSARTCRPPMPAISATEMDWRATYLSLVSSVAERYFQIRQFDEQIAQQTASKKQAEDLLQIYKAQHAEGMVPETRIRSQKAEISSLDQADCSICSAGVTRRS